MTKEKQINSNKQDVPTIGIVCLGDIVARPGREALARDIEAVRAKYNPNIIIVNAENASGGTGLEAKEAREDRKSVV